MERSEFVQFVSNVYYYPADRDISPIWKQLESRWDAGKSRRPNLIQAVWHRDNIFTNFERLWSTLKNEADDKFSRPQYLRQNKGLKK